MRLRRALDEFVVDGVETTIPLFQRSWSRARHRRRRLRHPLAGGISGPAGGRRKRLSRNGTTRGGRGDETCHPLAAPQGLRLRHLSDGGFGRRPERSTGSSRQSGACCRSTSFQLPRRLARTVRADVFEIRIDTDFAEVIDGCAAARPGRRSTWINATIRELYGELFRLGHVHTVEAWRDGALVGGLYGVKLGGAFFGESMFAAGARRVEGGADAPRRAAAGGAASPCSTRSSSPSTSRASARSRRRARNIISCSTRRWSGKASSGRSRPTRRRADPFPAGRSWLRWPSVRTASPRDLPRDRGPGARWALPPRREVLPPARGPLPPYNRPARHRRSDARPRGGRDWPRTSSR